uniref:RNA-directed DNA polymerase, eukaryota, reverse transcriptase zinc-binding domain protein n=1 Tax=Tanacetum cinerariifolium TaxID=118510 RepID=A0A699HVP9_TANCI|nr:RNA-directed DNA polymerase, eukaryota, reverse transcriptase zinc-binding domain protein [Tanacetum cinerariifolium]
MNSYTFMIPDVDVEVEGEEVVSRMEMACLLRFGMINGALNFLLSNTYLLETSILKDTNSKTVLLTWRLIVAGRGLKVAPQAPNIALVPAPNLVESQLDVLKWRDYGGKFLKFSVKCAWEALRPRGNEDIIAYLQPMAHRRNVISIIGRLLVAAASYFMWVERNNRLFKNVRRSSDDIRDIIMATLGVFRDIPIILCGNKVNIDNKQVHARHLLPDLLPPQVKFDIEAQTLRKEEHEIALELP